MIRGSKSLWCQPFSAKVISMVVKIVFIAHCNEEKSMLWAIGGTSQKGGVRKDLLDLGYGWVIFGRAQKSRGSLYIGVSQETGVIYNLVPE